MSLITSKKVIGLWDYLGTIFDSTVEQKNDSAIMKAAAELISTLGIQDKEKFLEDFVTTLGKTIYVPFKIGDGYRWSLWSQITVAVHEHQHIVQGERESWPVFDARYVSSSSFRAGYEAEAYGCDLEMEFWRSGKIIDIGARVSSLKHYGCTDEDIAQAKQMLEIRAMAVSHGVVENKASIAAIAWLEANASEIRC